jgi:hypothetical protein
VRRATIGPILLLALLAGCGGGALRFQPLVTHRVFNGPSKGEVFDAAVRVVHNSDYLVAAANKDSGLIATDWRRYALNKFVFQSRINLLVMDESPGYIAVSFKSVVQYRDKDGWHEVLSGDRFNSKAFRQLTQALDNFYLELQRYVGPSVQRR